MTENNMRQALVIEGSVVLENEYGLAPGIYYEKDGKTAVMLPGPPYEMAPMLKNKLFPILEARTGYTLVSRNIHIFGVGESRVEDILHEMMVTGTNPHGGALRQTRRGDCACDGPSRDKRGGPKDCQSSGG